MLLKVKSIRVLFAIILMLFLGGEFAGAVQLSPSLENMMESRAGANHDSLVKVVLFYETDNHSGIVKKAAGAARADFKSRHRMAIENLKSVKSGVLDNILDKINCLNPGANIRKYWIASALAFEIPVSALETLINCRGVVSIFEDGALEYIEPVESSLVPAKVGTVYGHLDYMNIPNLWSMGIDGSGTIICNFDTGVDGDHPALQSKWRGNIESFSATWFAPHQDGNIPDDVVGHGTQTMGLMVGSVDADTFGVAPGAEWIGAAVVDQGQTLSNTISDILDAFEWAVDPDGDPETVDDVPDVILNSWGIPTTIMDPCDETFYQVIDNVESAGVITVYAAGNEGPTSYSLRIPANRASSPLNSFAVGAINHTTGEIASFSSRGPSSCDSSQIKPEVVAPGVGLYTSYKNGGYRYASGTSMAAPLIAGLAALLRQYNPEATVDEIKTAIIESATDMGEEGEDNTYGHGMPDAAKALALLPAPTNPDLEFAGTIIGDDGLADPGETFNLFIKLKAIANTFDSLTGYLLCDNENVSIVDNQAAFIFAPGNTQSINVDPFDVSFSEMLLHGQQVSFRMAVDRPYGVPFDTLDFELTVGSPPNGTIYTHVTSKMEFTITDFGQYGLADNSAYPAGGEGFRFLDSDNLLYEAGIIIGRNALQLSSSVRDTLGRADRSDFVPIQKLNSGQALGGGCSTYSEFVDTNADISIPIVVSQEIVTCDESGEDQYVLAKYFLKNNTNEPITGLSFGFFCDFDINQFNDQIGMDYGMNLLYQTADNVMIGLMPITSYCGIKSVENGSAKLTLSKQDKLDLIQHEGIEINDSINSDFMSVISFGPYDIAPYDSVEISLAVVVGENLGDLEYFAGRALEKYYGFTDIAEQADNIPQSFELEQNYPNPFNPSTTISFNMNVTSRARLNVINMLGQQVVTLFDDVAHPGQYSVTWNGKDKNGSKVASGIYFYQLKTDNSAQTRKMLMLK